jgi:hypothetical protein
MFRRISHVQFRIFVADSSGLIATGGLLGARETSEMSEQIAALRVDGLSGGP